MSHATFEEESSLWARLYSMLIHAEPADGAIEPGQQTNGALIRWHHQTGRSAVSCDPEGTGGPYEVEI